MCDGSAPRQVSRDSVDAENPAATRDGRSVIYSSAHPTKYGLWRVPLEGGAEEHLLSGGTLIPDLSPDGRFLSTILAVGTLEPKLVVLDLETGRMLPGAVTVRPVPGIFVIGRARWLADGSAVAYTAYDANGRCLLVRRSLEFWRTGAGKPDTLFRRTTDDIESFGFSPDGRRATVSVLDYLSGLTIAEAVKGIVPPKRASPPGRR